MSPDSFRFTPPQFELPAEAQWVMMAALSSAPPTPASHLDQEELLLWLQRLGLAERLAFRHPPDLLLSTLGQTIHDALVTQQRRAAGRTLMLIELARTIADAALQLETPVVLLKGVALMALEVTPVGSRDASDVDALVPRGKAQQLANDLVARGFEQSQVHESSQHLPALIHPRMGLTEIHVALRELRINAPRDAEFEDLEKHQLLSPIPDLANTYAPSPEVLAAHALAHGIAQHGRSPKSYPFLRMMADLQDIAPHIGSFEEMLDAARPFLQKTVSQRELNAVLELERCFRSGFVAATGDGAALLRHPVAGTLSPDYQDSLKAGAFWSAVKRRDWQKISRRISHSLTAGSKVDDSADSEKTRKGLVEQALGVLRVGWAWLKRSR